MIPKLRILFWIGVFTLCIPYLGITNGIRTAITVFVGVLIIWLTFRMRKQYKELRFKLRRLEEVPTTPELDINTH